MITTIEEYIAWMKEHGYDPQKDGYEYAAFNPELVADPSLASEIIELEVKRINLDREIENAKLMGGDETFLKRLLDLKQGLIDKVKAELEKKYEGRKD